MPRLSLFCFFFALACFVLAFYFGLRLPEQICWPPTAMVSGFWLCLMKGMFFLFVGYVFSRPPGQGIPR